MYVYTHTRACARANFVPMAGRVKLNLRDSFLEERARHHHNYNEINNKRLNIWVTLLEAIKNFLLTHYCLKPFSRHILRCSLR